MEDLVNVISLPNPLGLGGLGVFIYWLVRGLSQRVSALTQLVNDQKDTLKAVRARANEMERLSGAYKKALCDYEKMGQKIDHRRDTLLRELEEDNKHKDEEVRRIRTKSHKFDLIQRAEQRQEPLSCIEKYTLGETQYKSVNQSAQYFHPAIYINLLLEPEE